MRMVDRRVATAVTSTSVVAARCVRVLAHLCSLLALLVQTHHWHRVSGPVYHLSPFAIPDSIGYGLAALQGIWGGCRSTQCRCLLSLLLFGRRPGFALTRMSEMCLTRGASASHTHASVCHCCLLFTVQLALQTKALFSSLLAMWVTHCCNALADTYAMHWHDKQCHCSANS